MKSVVDLVEGMAISTIHMMFVEFVRALAISSLVETRMNGQDVVRVGDMAISTIHMIFVMLAEDADNLINLDD